MDQELPVANLRRAEYLNWQQDPVTKLVHGAILERVKELHLELGSGTCLGNETLYAQYVGYIQGLRSLFNIEVEEDDGTDKDA